MEQKNAHGKARGRYGWTSLLGSDKKNLLADLPSKLLNTLRPETVSTVVEVWTAIADIYKVVNNWNPEKDPKQFLLKAKLWISLFLSLQGKKEGYKRNRTQHICLSLESDNTPLYSCLLGCESKLLPDTPTGACFPQGYTIYRKESEFGSGGGVFLAIADTLTSIGHPEFCSDDSNKSVWASIKLRGNKLLHLCSFYKPPSAPVSRIDYIADILADLHQRTSCSCPSVVVSGDLNVGDIN